MMPKVVRLGNHLCPNIAGRGCSTRSRSVGDVGDRIDDLIEAVTTDASGDHEQLSSFAQAFADTARFPVRGRVVGVEVEVVGVEFDGNERWGLVAVCRRGGEDHSVSLLDVTPTGPLSIETSELFDAYRRWAGVPPLGPAEPEVAGRWAYRRLAAVDIDVTVPLALNPMGDWDPAQEYWGDPGDPVDPLWQEVIAAGVRPAFEMEQVLPGVDPDDWDSDPIADAAELHAAGHDREATAMLRELLELDRRCVDAWGHLGTIAFHTQGPGRARELYETGVAIAERSLPEGFGGVLLRGFIDNRPFLRCLHGLGLCAWRQRRWDEAEAIFTSRVWLDPPGSLDALACLEQVRARQRWTGS